eukprot:GHVQ01012975.1.p1 GENE.GHVQ01012975.1~~GHVQ01012975.1.p1  ORF type:complete len:345 (-),score=38.10 GHVQ01012975.1:1758-2792(-)
MEPLNAFGLNSHELAARKNFMKTEQSLDTPQDGGNAADGEQGLRRWTNASMSGVGGGLRGVVLEDVLKKRGNGGFYLVSDRRVRLQDSTLLYTTISDPHFRRPRGVMCLDADTVAVAPSGAYEGMYFPIMIFKCQKLSLLRMKAFFASVSHGANHHNFDPRSSSEFSQDPCTAPPSPSSGCSADTISSVSPPKNYPLSVPRASAADLMPRPLPPSSINPSNPTGQTSPDNLGGVTSVGGTACANTELSALGLQPFCPAPMSSTLDLGDTSDVSTTPPAFSPLHSPVNSSEELPLEKTKATPIVSDCTIKVCFDVADDPKYIFCADGREQQRLWADAINHTSLGK